VTLREDIASVGHKHKEPVIRRRIEDTQSYAPDKGHDVYVWDRTLVNEGA